LLSRNPERSNERIEQVGLGWWRIGIPAVARNMLLHDHSKAIESYKTTRVRPSMGFKMRFIVDKGEEK